MAGAPTNGVSRAGLWLSVATSAFIVFGAIGSIFYIGFKVQATSDIQDARGRRIALIEDRMAAIQDRLIKIEVAQNEIETQFCSEDEMRNVIHAADLRTLALIWKKAFGDDLNISNAYYPRVCRRHDPQK
jgi:hypothetical protein